MPGPAEAPALSVTDDTARIGKQPMENSCAGGAGAHHACGPNDRFCTVLRTAPLCFFRPGFLPEYDTTETYKALRDAETETQTQYAVQILIMPDGTTQLIQQEAQEWQSSAIVTTRAPGLIPSLVKEIDRAANPVVLIPGILYAGLRDRNCKQKPGKRIFRSEDLFTLVSCQRGSGADWPRQQKAGFCGRSEHDHIPGASSPSGRTQVLP